MQIKSAHRQISLSCILYQILKRGNPSMHVKIVTLYDFIVFNLQLPFFHSLNCTCTVLHHTWNTQTSLTIYVCGALVLSIALLTLPQLIMIEWE